MPIDKRTESQTNRHGQKHAMLQTLPYRNAMSRKETCMITSSLAINTHSSRTTRNPYCVHTDEITS